MNIIAGHVLDGRPVPMKKITCRSQIKQLVVGQVLAELGEDRSVYTITYIHHIQQVPMIHANELIVILERKPSNAGLCSKSRNCYS